ncbi:MAG TPA: phosphatase PAP2 family protein [Burkholderiales bacterium]|nr:phosphatase PAP2 family protein [Burkholderiales bacterium]
MTAAARDWSWRSPRVWLVPVLALLGGGVLIAAGANERVFLLLNRLGPATSDALWANITILGDTTVALALGLALARRRAELLWAVVPVALLATAWSRACKYLVDIPRPPTVLSADAVHVIGPAYHFHSFPSGHATTAFALAALCVLGFRLRAWSLVPVAIAALVGISRCAVGVHWPLDVLGGVFGGWLAAALGLRAAAQLPFGLRPSVQWVITVALAGCAVALIVGYPTDYPQALWLQRAIGAACLAAFAATFVPARGSRAAQG